MYEKGLFKKKNHLIDFSLRAQVLTPNEIVEDVTTSQNDVCSQKVT